MREFHIDYLNGEFLELYVYGAGYTPFERWISQINEQLAT